jgi:hypothetical protein
MDKDGRQRMSTSAHHGWAFALVVVAILAMFAVMAVACADSCNAMNGYATVTTYPDGHVVGVCK